MMLSSQSLIRNTLPIVFLTLCLSASTALAASGPGDTPEQVEPKVQQPPVAQVDPQLPQNPPTQPTLAPKPKPTPQPQVVETPLEDIWEGMLDFFYGSETDSTRTK